jgi:hypothetical protein
MFQRAWLLQVGDNKNTKYLGGYKRKVKFYEKEKKSRFYVKDKKQ